MKNIILLTVLLFLSAVTHSQEKKEYGKVYNPEADARADIKGAVMLAQKEHKNILLQIGGNWCMWCIRFHNLVEGNDTLRNLLHNNYEVVHVNYDKNNKEDSLWAELGYPQRFGFPVFVVLDENGNRIHIQNSAYLEEADGHSIKKVVEFLEQWSPAAIYGKL
jgi:thioredoxin-related protein